MKTGSALIVGLAIGLAGCAGSYEPVVDLKGVDHIEYQSDLEECRAYAENVDVGSNAATGGAVGAGVGAAAGAAVGAITGAPGRGAAIGAAGGGTSGLFGGLFRGTSKEKRIIRNCLRGRGYRVLD
ncbi:MAG: glycine zipper family protein [Hyphomicrobiales bacterium]|nr:glycine zipper family protein [Hyphomicrobiales bacterium]